MSTQIPMFGGALPVWADVLIGVLLIISGLLSFTGALGLVRIREFFTRLHPLALGSTLALWCVAAALVLCFSFTYQTLVLRAWLVVVFMAITAPPARMACRPPLPGRCGGCHPRRRWRMRGRGTEASYSCTTG